ncbi:MAG: Holliday junction resolvase-like protein [Terriglobales bacterium]
MKSDLLTYYRIHRNVFGVCPCCNQIFRLSDSNIYLRKKPKNDWLDRYDHAEERVTRSETLLLEQEKPIRKLAQDTARRIARSKVSSMVCMPRNVDPEDVKLLFHPVDYIVFRGMGTKRFRSILLLDRKSPSKDRQALQRSIAKTVEQRDYDWLTLRIGENGKVSEE